MSVGLLAAPLLATLAAVVLAACGSSQSQLIVNLSSDGGNTSSRPTDITAWTLTVTNRGPGGAGGVRAQLDLPATYEYVATPQIDKDFLGATRVQDHDPSKDTRTPEWGSWALAAPSTNADHTIRYAFVTVHFQLRSGGTPGDYTVVPRAVGDTADSEVTGQPVNVHLEPAPDLKLDLSATPPHVARGDDVLYRVTVDNFGTGPAADLNVLVTLPPGLDFVRTEQVSGNSSRNQPVDPVPGALLVFYGGFTVPAKGPAGPGLLVITLRGRCSFCTGGSFTSSAQLTDRDGAVVVVKDAAQVTVAAPTAPPTPVVPLPPMAPSGTPTPKPTTP